MKTTNLVLKRPLEDGVVLAAHHDEEDRDVGTLAHTIPVQIYTCTQLVACTVKQRSQICENPCPYHHFSNIKSNEFYSNRMSGWIYKYKLIKSRESGPLARTNTFEIYMRTDLVACRDYCILHTVVTETMQ